jgi:hypothetical protein
MIRQSGNPDRSDRVCRALGHRLCVMGRLSGHRQEGSNVNKNCVVLSCSLIFLFVLTATAFAQGGPPPGPGILGTPPPAGHTIEEVATAVENITVGPIELSPESPGAFDIELLLPVFPSSGLPAEPSQCLWSITPLFSQSSPVDPGNPRFPFMFTNECTLEGRNLHVEVWASFPSGGACRWSCLYEVTAVAIRTAPPAPVESKSFGEIKAMYR